MVALMAQLYALCSCEPSLINPDDLPVRASIPHSTLSSALGTVQEWRRQQAGCGAAGPVPDDAEHHPGGDAETRCRR